MRTHFDRITTRITTLGGTYHLLPIRSLPPEEEAKIVEGFMAQSNAQYQEIIENCEVNFTKEIEFETFRKNFTYAEAEEIRHDLDKIRSWFDRVVERDWYGAARREEAVHWIERCEELLEAFEEKVFAVQEADEAALPPTEAGEGMVETPRVLRPRRSARRGRSASR